MAPLSPVGIGRRPNLWCSAGRRPHEHPEVYAHEYPMPGLRRLGLPRPQASGGRLLPLRRRRRRAGMKPLLTPAELEALDCQLRSGIAPDLETARRLVARVRELEEALRWQERRLEYAR